MTKKVLLCDCLGSQRIDGPALGAATGLTCSRVHTALCTREADRAAEAMTAGEVIIACGQEQRRFEEIAADLGAATPDFVDLRDRAGWSDEGAEAGPKMAALLADAARDARPVKTMDISSEGMCLILGDPDAALSAAAQLSEHLSVTVLLEGDGEALDPPDGFDIVLGRLRQARGGLGAFELKIDGLREAEPGGRGPLTFGTARDGARSVCDLVVDLRRAPALFPAPDKRDGYFRADPGRPAAVADAVRAASHMVGTFEKPLYVSLTEPLCAHSRAGKPACSNCLDHCPTGAITSAGEHVAIDPLICAGCGACAVLCPSGAIQAEDPATDTLFARITTLADGFRKAGGTNPRLLVHSPDGAEMIRLAARHGRGLPAAVVPLELEKVTRFGHAELLAALATGFVGVDILLPGNGDRDVVTREIDLASALAGPSPSLRLLDITDPDALCDQLYGTEAPAPVTPILPLGTRRDVTRLAARALNPELDSPLPLPAGAPYGTVEVDASACTLCLSCAGLCPAGALGDNEDTPQLRFQEDACLQCGLCVQVCPESAISLVPRMDLSDTALSQRVIHEEEPFPCITCGKLFGSKSTVERITEKLAGHSMFAGSDRAKLIQMCDDCRIQAQYHSEDNPFAASERPRVRTTEDYLSKRRDH